MGDAAKRSERLIMDPKLKRIEKAYDAIAKEYAGAFAGEHEKKPKDREMLLRFSQEIGDGRPVWDFGCGPGQTAAYLKTLGIEISGLDLSERMLQEARNLHPGIRFQKGDLLELEFEADSIAGVVAFYAIVHFNKEQAGRAFGQVFRVLQPGGVFLFTYHVGDETTRIDEFLGKKVDIDFTFFTGEFISPCLAARGFERIEIIERAPYPEVEYPSRRAYVFAVKPSL